MTTTTKQHPHPAWALLAERLSDCHYLCQSHPDDFYKHDTKYLGEVSTKEPFWVLLYGGGTHLFEVMRRDRGRSKFNSADLMWQCVQDFGRSKTLSPNGFELHFWDGSHLQLVSPERCQELIEQTQEALRYNCSSCHGERDAHPTGICKQFTSYMAEA